MRFPRRTLAATMALLVSWSTTAALAAQPAGWQRLIDAAESQVGRTVYYDPAYTKLAYPGGDVPIERGVCSDVVIRAFRSTGVDFQVLVHQDMAAHFAAYPKRWSLKRPDRNIDHRRVLNLATYLRRAGKAVATSGAAKEYLPGDIVSWDLVGNGSLPHIGIVSDRWVSGEQRRLIVHNIGAGTKVEDILFAYEITGHFRWIGR